MENRVVLSTLKRKKETNPCCSAEKHQHFHTIGCKPKCCQRRGVSASSEPREERQCCWGGRAAARRLRTQLQKALCHRPDPLQDKPRAYPPSPKSCRWSSRMWPPACPPHAWLQGSPFDAWPEHRVFFFRASTTWSWLESTVEILCGRPARGTAVITSLINWWHR